MANTISINNRRYLGNKYRLLPFIKGVVESECDDIRTFFDIFAGTGAVASAFRDRTVITNDILYSSYICSLAWFSPAGYDPVKLERIIDGYNALSVTAENYMTDNFSDTYFSRADCAKIGHVREDIESRFLSGEVTERERALLITSLLYAMDRIAKTCGHYDAYRRGAEFDRHLEMALPSAAQDNDSGNRCYNTDSNELARRVSADLVYIDPPYNSRQYCDAYHLLENVARWNKPEVFGVAGKMDRAALKSRYCTKEAASAFEDLVAHLNCRYILLSYNNMAEKGNDRSNAKIGDGDILRILSSRGEVKVFSEEYRAFTAGLSDRADNRERLFLCKCEGGTPV